MLLLVSILCWETKQIKLSALKRGTKEATMVVGSSMARTFRAAWARLGIGILVAATLAVAACEADSGPSAPRGERRIVDHGDDRTTPDRRAVGIYAAVIRRLVTEDHTFGGGPSPFDHVYVLDAPRVGAGDAVEPGARSDGRFSREMKESLQTRLAALPPIDFIPRSRAARQGSGLQTRVKKNGVIISVGPIIGRGRSVKVSNSLWCGSLCGQWQTYRVKLEGGSWQVQGTVGVVAIS
jgi:hypothetical protein